MASEVAVCQTSVDRECTTGCVSIKAVIDLDSAELPACGH